jgi:integrase
VGVRALRGKKKEKLGPGWVADKSVSTPSGKVVRINKIFLGDVTKRSVEEWLRLRVEEIMAGRTSLGPAPTFSSFVDTFLKTYTAKAGNKASETHEKRRVLKKEFIPLWGDRTIDKISTEDIDTYVAEKLRSGAKPKTVHNYLTILSTLFSVAVRWKKIDRAPEIHKPRFKQGTMRVLTEEEASALLEVGRGKWQLMVRTALLTGMRLGELRALEVSDVDFENKRILVKQAAWHDVIGAPKDGESRYVPLSPSLASELRKHIGPRRFLFADRAGKMLHHDTCATVLRYYSKGLKGGAIGWHVLRHTFATTALRNGIDIKTVSSWLGHSDIKITSRYLHYIESRGADQIVALDAAFSRGPNADHFVRSAQVVENASRNVAPPTGVEPVKGHSGSSHQIIRLGDKS